jgi:RimJ/RimL family protein N-acetyltransferase
MRGTIPTERLILRPLELADARRIAALAAAPEVARMVASIPLPFPHICAEGWILILKARAPLGLDHVYAVERPGEGIIGCIGAHRRPTGGPAEFGYWIGRPYWGCGFATEAARAAAGEARGHWALRAGHFVDNPASGRVLEKAGFCYTGATELRFSLARAAKTETRLMELAA